MSYYPRSKVNVLDCSECAALFVSHYRRHTCSPTCELARRARIGRERYATSPETHRARVAEARQDPEIAAKFRESAKAWRQRAGYFDSKRAGDQRRRARKLAVPTENVRAGEVFARDSWTCGICSSPVDRSLPWPDPKSASLDHVLPLARGGSHTYDNVRLAHLDCNMRRGARVEVA